MRPRISSDLDKEERLWSSYPIYCAIYSGNG